VASPGDMSSNLIIANSDVTKKTGRLQSIPSMGSLFYSRANNNPSDVEFFTPTTTNECDH